MAQQQYNLDNIRSLDCRDIVERYLGQPVGRSSKTNLYRCPIHGGHKASLSVWQDGWKCWADCNDGGDIIKFVMLYKRCDFKEALIELGAELAKPKRPVAQQSPVARSHSEPPPYEWQFYASQIVHAAAELLWTPEGAQALEYLRGRGLDDNTIKWQNIGYIKPANNNEVTYGRVPCPDWLVEGKAVRIPCGVTIPHFDQEGTLWGVRVRRSAKWGEPKYMGIRGGSRALYAGAVPVDGRPALIVEGEFDAMIADQCLFGLVNSWALASASNAALSQYWLSKLVTSPTIYTRFDSDAAGQKATAVLGALSKRVRPLALPDGAGKDINEFYTSAGADAVREWFLSQVEF